MDITLAETLRRIRRDKERTETVSSADANHANRGTDAPSDDR